MIDTVVNELEGFKSKLQETIDHVKSGQGNLNEDQIDAAKVMLVDLDDAFADMIGKSRDLLNAALVPPEPEPVPVAESDPWRDYAAHLELQHGFYPIASDQTRMYPPVVGGLVPADAKPEIPAALQAHDDGPAFKGLQPVSENLKTVVDEKPAEDSEVVHLDSSWKQHDSAGREVVVHDDGAGPTAEDLDAHAAEQAAKDATA